MSMNLYVKILQVLAFEIYIFNLGIIPTVPIRSEAGDMINVKDIRVPAVLATSLIETLLIRSHHIIIP